MTKRILLLAAIALSIFAFRMGIDLTAGRLVDDSSRMGNLIENGVFALALVALLALFPSAFKSRQSASDHV